MKFVSKIALALILTLLATPLVGLADDPSPCYPCTGSGSGSGK